MQEKRTILSIRNLTKSFYALIAVNDISFDIYEREILGVIGPNGSGKTTLFNCITGIYSPERGSIRYLGKEIAGKSEYNIAKLGIRRTFQTIRLFKDMSVAENIYSGYYTTSSQNIFHALTHLGNYLKDEAAAWEDVKGTAEFFGISGYLTQRAGDLPYGVQRKVEIARAMLAKPKLLILDEPAAGMNDVEKKGLSKMIAEIAKDGVTVLMIEHDMNMLMNLSGRVIVLNQGTLIANGLPNVIQNDKQVIEAYMGTEE